MSGRQQWFMEDRLLKDGTVEKRIMCVVCNVPMQHGTWQELRSGILYEVRGWKCPTSGCTMEKEEAYNLIGPPG